MNNEEIFANYKRLQNGSDIRGIALEGIEGQEINLSEKEVFNISRGFANWLSIKLEKPISSLKIAVGRDSRLSGPTLMHSALTGIMSEGARAIDTALSSTPAMFMSTVFPEIAAEGSIMLTASHLPWNRNGMKFFSPDGGLNKADITEILRLAADYEFDGALGKSKTSKEQEAASAQKTAEAFNLMDRYSAHLRELIIKGVAKDQEDNGSTQNDYRSKPLQGMHILVDAGNGAGGFFATQVLAPLGADITGSLFLDPDGTFPNHPPNPEDPGALDCIRKELLVQKGDLGLIFDTDVDRIGAVDSKGSEIARNRIVALAAVFAKEKHPGTTVVTDSVTSTQLQAFLENELGLKHHRFQRGYRNVINESIRLNANGIDSQLAIETSGHGAFKDNYFLDDGAYLATLITIKATALKRKGKEISSILDNLEDPLEAVEIRLPINRNDFQAYGEKVLADLKSWVEEQNDPDIQLELPNYEGVRVKLSGKYGNGWFLLRKSLHDPLLPLNIESNESLGTDKIRALIRPFFKEYEYVDIKNL